MDMILSDWLRSDSGAAYPTVLDQLPNPLPFTAKEADIWYETPSENTSFTKITRGIFRSASFRAAKYMTKMQLMSFDVTAIEATVTRMAYHLTKTIEDPKIYVRVGNMSWYYYKGEAYAGDEHLSPLIVLSWEPFQITLHGNDYYVTNEQVQEGHRQETSHVTKAPVYLALSRERARKKRVWDKVLSLFPPDSKSVSSSFTAKMKFFCSKVWEHVQGHVYVMLTLMVITIIAAIIVQYVKGKREAIDIPRSTFSCAVCWLDQERPMYNNACPGSPDYNCAKGKGRRKYSNFVNVNTK